jgi:hypothetical protein
MVSEANLKRLIDQLRATARTHDLHVRAAVELLITQETYLRRTSFTTECLVATADGVYVRWSKARSLFDAGAFLPSGGTELALLDLAIAIGENRYRFSLFGPETARMALDALTDVLDDQARHTTR